MRVYKPSPARLGVKRTYLAICAISILVPLNAVSYFVRSAYVAGNLLVLAFYFFASVIYEPLAYKNVFYRVGEGRLEIEEGIAFKKKTYASPRLIKCVEVKQNLVQRAFDTYTACLYLPGRRIKIVDLDVYDARILKEDLSRNFTDEI